MCVRQPQSDLTDNSEMVWEISIKIAQVAAWKIDCLLMLSSVKANS